jgi:hypothetical protein
MSIRIPIVAATVALVLQLVAVTIRILLWLGERKTQREAGSSHTGHSHD